MDRNPLNSSSIKYSDWEVVSLLGIIGIISFGLLIPYLGFFWDDFPLAWIAETYGRDGLARYFSTNRPYWGMLYVITTPFLGSTPWHWQLFGLVWRIFASISFWLLVRQLWPQRYSFALFSGIAFLVYPGFNQQWISLIYSHFFIVMTAFFISLNLNIKAVRLAFMTTNSVKTSIYTGIALLLSLVNLVSLEYFFTLELIRVILIWIVLGDFIKEKRKRLGKTVKAWIPYLLSFVGVIVWRAFFFPYQTSNYQFSLLERLSSEPIEAVLSLTQNIIISLWKTGILAWVKVFQPPNLNEVGRITAVLSLMVVLASFLGIAAWLYIMSRRSAAGFKTEEIDTRGRKGSKSTQVLWIGLTALFLAGWPFWLIDLVPDLNFSLDRFTLPFMVGSALLVTGIIELMRIKFFWKSLIFTILISFSMGKHFQYANDYRRDWDVQRRFFWQMVWRIPDLKPGTTVLVNELPLTYYSDNSLTAPLNWIYAPENQTEYMSYLLLYPERRLGTSLPSLVANKSIEVDYLAASFSGNTSQMITVNYDPPACLRVLDPKLDAVNHMLPLLMQKSATLSSMKNISWETGTPPANPPEEIYSPEEKHGWCYYYQKAELAKQQGDWEEVTRLADAAFALGDYPNDPAERTPFIEGYAYTGNWQRAVQLTEESLDVSPDMMPVLCIVWRRMETDTEPSSEKDEAYNNIASLMNCFN